MSAFAELEPSTHSAKTTRRSHELAGQAVALLAMWPLLAWLSSRINVPVWRVQRGRGTQPRALRGEVSPGKEKP